MAFAFQWPLVIASARWRLIYGSLLLGLLPLRFALCLYEDDVYECFGGVVSTWFGLCLGLVHVPGSSAGRHGSWRCSVVRRGLITFLSTCLVGYPCVLWTFPALRLHQDERGVIFDPGGQTLTLVLLSLIWICCMLRKHPRSACTHDAKWCMFTFWLVSVAWQASCICSDLNQHEAGPCFYHVGGGVQCVAHGWVLYLLQMRMMQIRSDLEQASCSNRSQIWILVMCGSWLIRNMSVSIAVSSVDGGSVKAWPFVVSLSVLCAVWVAYTALMCRILSLKSHLLLQETRRIRGLPRKQAIWASKVVGVEMLIFATLGVAMCFHGIVSGMFMYEYVQLRRAPSEADYRRLLFTWGDRIFEVTNTNWVVNSVGLGLLSGILWQVQPPNDDPQSAGELTRGLVSMSSLLSPKEKEVYDKVVKQLANRGFGLAELLRFWRRLLDGQMMPGFDPQLSWTNDVVRRAIIPESRTGHGGSALATK
eukprot:s209_g14.t1